MSKVWVCVATVLAPLFLSLLLCRQAALATIQAAAENTDYDLSAASDYDTIVPLGKQVGLSGWKPCPSSGPCKILPLGDSITDGCLACCKGGYRIQLFRNANKNGAQITFVGSMRNGPANVDGKTFPQRHEGHNGWTIAQDTALVPATALKEIPHIILVHLGTNDIWKDMDTAPQRLGVLLDKLMSGAPNALIVVAKLTPLVAGRANMDGKVRTYNAAIPSVVQTRVAKGGHLIMVDMHGLPSSEIDDGTHPTAAGYAHMGNIWWAALSPYLLNGGAGAANSSAGGGDQPDSPAPTKVTKCVSGLQGSRLDLTCPTGQTITAIPFASYGSPTTACKSGKCSTGTAVTVMKKMCLSKRTCWISPDDSQFGSKCAPSDDTVKQRLSVSYTCSSVAVVKNGQQTGDEQSAGDSEQSVSSSSSMGSRMLIAAGVVLTLVAAATAVMCALPRHRAHMRK